MHIYNDHYRGYIDIDELNCKLKELGFVVDYIEEAQGFSKTEKSDPVLMRVIARVKHNYRG